MQRTLMDSLVAWKDEPDRKPLLLQGIRHSGKTFLLKDFGTKYFGDIAYIDFSEEKSVIDLFGQNTDPLSIIKDLSIYLERDIKPGETLVVFDEVRLCTGVLESLGRFRDSAPQYHVAAASSFLSVTVPKGTSIPVNKIDVRTLHPMNFFEFLLAQSPMLANHLRESGFNGEAYRTFNRQLEEKFRDYLIVGGMPEVVFNWIENKSIETVDRLLSQIIKGFESDFAVFCPITMLPKLIAIWNAVPAQLIKGNRKFMFSKVKKSWRGKDLDDALFLLVRAGLIHKAVHIEKPDIPISGYVNPSHFKLYMCDPGLLRRLGGFRTSMLVGSNSSYQEIKDAMTQNAICCELVRIFGDELYYWSADNPGKAEVDFIVCDQDLFIPIEVKSGSAGRARSLLQYRQRFSPKKYVLTGMDNDKEHVIPLYAFWNLKEWLK